MLQYEEIMNRLIWEIKANKYPVGSHLPCERELAARFGTSQKTIHNAITRLAAKGFIESRHGSGNYVISISPEGEKFEHIAIIMNCSHQRSSDDFLTTKTFTDMIGSINSFIRPRGAATELMIYQEDEPFTENMPEIVNGGYYLNLFFTATNELAKIVVSHGGTLLSTVTTFHERRFIEEYPGMPYVLWDYKAALKKAFEFYKGQGINKYVYFAQGRMGWQNYDIFADIAAECGLEIAKYHYKLKNKSEVDIYSGKRVRYFRNALLDQPENSVVFSDGTELVAELFHSFDGDDEILKKYKFCLAGINDSDIQLLLPQQVDYIPFRGDRIAIYAAQSLLDYISDRREIPLKQKFEAEFICGKDIIEKNDKDEESLS